MKTPPLPTLLALLFCSASLLSPAAPRQASGPAALELSASTGAPQKLSFQGRAIPLVEKNAGGFIITDFKKKQKLQLSRGKISKEGDIYKYTAAAGDVLLRATFTPRGDCVEVSGEVETTRPAERALIVRYVLPLPTDAAIYQNSLSKSVPVSKTTNELGTVFPIAAITGKDWGAALSIPPSFPCCFGMTGTAEGLGVEFYLGVTPVTRDFPGKAAFKFTISAAAPVWGFRSALAQYYERHSDYYKVRYDTGGFWNWNDPAGVGTEEGKIAEEAWPLFKAHGVPKPTTDKAKSLDYYKAQAARDERHGVLTFAYNAIGPREISKLKALPKDYDGAMAVFNKFVEEWNKDTDGGPVRRKYVPPYRNTNLPAQIINSTMHDESGRYIYRARNTAWGGDSITFIENPNPRLFDDKGLDTTGSVTLKDTLNMLAEMDDGTDGIMIDSLGATWPGWMNYRADHFPYARYPLTFDKTGRIGLHNMISHYEWLETAREEIRKREKLLMGNGIDLYKRSQAITKEHYNSRDNGRFFIAAQMDFVGRELTSDLLSRERLEAFRIFMGRKVFAPIIYEWKDQIDVKAQMEHSLAFDIFTGPNRFFIEKVSYILAPDGYARDKEFLEWFIKNARILHNAGWEPVTHAMTGNPGIVCERFGDGDIVYYTLLNMGEKPAECTLRIDMASLGFAGGAGGPSQFSEMARGAKISANVSGSIAQVKAALEPGKTYIIKLSRTK